MCGLALGVYRWVPVFKKGPLAAPVRGCQKGLIVTFFNGQIQSVPVFPILSTPGDPGDNSSLAPCPRLEKIGGLFQPLFEPEIFWLCSMCRLALGVYGQAPVFKEGPLAVPIRGCQKGQIVTFLTVKFSRFPIFLHSCLCYGAQIINSAKVKRLENLIYAKRLVTKHQ